MEIYENSGTFNKQNLHKVLKPQKAGVDTKFEQNGKNEKFSLKMVKKPKVEVHICIHDIYLVPEFNEKARSCVIGQVNFS